MKKIGLSLLFTVLSISSTYAVEKEFSRDEISINGMKVSGRTHWNLVNGAGPELVFCWAKGFNGVFSYGTTYERVAEQEMVFVTAPLLGKKLLVKKTDETLMLTKTVCTDQARNGIDISTIESAKKQIAIDIDEL